MNTKNKKLELNSSSIVGFFDSGIGGLTALQEFISMPIAQCIYVADTAHMPYGNKTHNEIYQFSEQIVRFLEHQHVDVIIVPCHTASAIALSHIQNTFPTIPIVGVVDGVTKKAVTLSRSKRIGIIATQATIESGAHKKSVLFYDADCLVFEQACPLLASAIEFGTHTEKDLDQLVLSYLQPLLEADIDTLILGSTHYDIIREQIIELTHNKLAYISAYEVIKNSLVFADQEKRGSPAITAYVTGNVNDFKNHFALLLPNQKAKILSLELNTYYSNFAGRITSSTA